MSSPKRLLGSTLNDAPSISPTSNSLSGPESEAETGICVPPVICWAFSGTESLGT